MQLRMIASWPASSARVLSSVVVIVATTRSRIVHVENIHHLRTFLVLSGIYLVKKG